ncbi:MAG: hypothetical protein DRN78_00455 [Thermoproteota archaeon]|nr:MAG: hypothetical protein DRN78_00455 [Candidatus Korarchaeota archaeon]
MTAILRLRDVVAYMVTRLKCVHPFYISRVLVLANWKAIEGLGKPMVEFSIEGFEAGFFIPELGELIDKDPCFERNKEKKCIEYVCDEPAIPSEYKEILDNVIENTKSLDIRELNRLVIRDPRYNELLRLRGFKH